MTTTAPNLRSGCRSALAAILVVMGSGPSPAGCPGMTVRFPRGLEAPTVKRAYRVTFSSQSTSACRSAAEPIVCSGILVPGV